MNDEYGLLIGAIIMLSAIPFHWKGKKYHAFYIVSVVLNSTASGFMVSALYFSRTDELTLSKMLAAAIPACIVLTLVYLMLQVFSKTKKVTVTVACILNAILTAAMIYFLITNGHIVFNLGFFCSLISFFFLCVFGITVNHDERLVLRDISFGCFGSFVIISIVVIFIVTEGEILDGAIDGADAALSTGLETKKQKRHR